MRVSSTVTRRVHIYLSDSERFVMEGVPVLEKRDTKRRACVRVIEVVAKHESTGIVVYDVMVRGQAVNRSGQLGSVDRTFQFQGLEAFPADIKLEIEALFRRQNVLSDPNEDYVVPRENGPTDVVSEVVESGRDAQPVVSWKPETEIQS